MAPWDKRLLRRGYFIYAFLVTAMTVAVSLYVSSSPGKAPWFAYFMVPGGVLCLFFPPCTHGVAKGAQLVIVAVLNVLAYVGTPLLVARIVKAFDRWTTLR